ncbi:Kinesin-like protein KIF21B [Grifola frondosa]|uniref:Kinesin-like protein KIF21B n=1 Tax=Grifola frondosa TaxID=5627 RepID=A0A1C7LS96_GRIFR|nr:Kinesin-like protein KIF21B [Grifola frondosa]
MAPSQPSTAASTSVQVALRIRPTTSQDLSSIPARFQRSVINAISSTAVSVDATPSSGPGAAPAVPTSSANVGKKQTFTFDQVHPPATTQHAMFTSTAQPLISRFVEGFNCTILAYGQTSSGKTFTMTGIDLDADPSDPSNGMGIIPRAVSTIFTRCREMKEERGNTWNFTIKGSYIEIYNEDLIDLLSDETGGRRDVQIREDKQGHIIWDGLREVAVKSSNEVMNLIRQGTAIRRTNETDMNAQSSRSHAIFSLTLTQKKFTGMASPLDHLHLSLLVAVHHHAWPDQAPSTPSFQSAITRGSRPASSLGFLSPDVSRGHNNVDDDQGEWVTVVSKFHFVDLAGSERLKRTAAAGERIKEGISINSGLLALGNVISALGDPARAKSHTASYIPYRDSKLTRLLQDSLGGNAHTLMIACISPAEWNTAETVNTLKYANRARNIKNRAVVNEKEEGWDDVEWLQGMVTRLRKELKGIKEGGGVSVGSVGAPETGERNGKMLSQMNELQNNYEDMREKYVERTEELTRLRQELAEKQRNSSGGRVGGTAKYEEIVGPVIEEYEKTISAMEAELKLNRAALRHTNDLYDEKDAEYVELSERHATTELYLEELKSRVAKLTEREASTEAYVRDLEEKVKHYDDNSISSSGSITELKRELSKFKDTESHASHYIAELEARLTRSDESVLALRETVAKLESECERRVDEVHVLQTRLDNLKRDGESWRTDLEEREMQVRALEQKMEEWEAKRKEAGDQRERLGDLVTEVAKARKDLEGTASPAKISGFSSGMESEVSSMFEGDSSSEMQLVALQQTHTATLADLSSVTAKYRDALREIADLAAQLQEAKVSAPLSSESPESAAEMSSPRRRMHRGMSRDGVDPQPNGSSRRLFFRQAASAESLHSRSLSQSVSLSQELSSARSRKASISSHGTSSSVSHTPSHSRPNLSISMPSIAVSPTERSVTSLEEEIMRLQEVLKEREAEITVLEQSLKDKERVVVTPPEPESQPTSLNGNGDASESSLMHLSPKTMSNFSEIRKSLDLHHTNTYTVSDVDESLERLNELMRSMAQKESSHREVVDDLNKQLTQVRRQHEELQVLSRDQTVNMSMELEALRKKLDEDVAKHDEDLDHFKQREVAFNESLAQAQLQEADLQRSLEDLKAREGELTESLKRAESEHSADIERLRSEHEMAMRTKESEVDSLLAKMKEEHEGALNGLHSQLSEASAALEKAHQEHQDAFGKLQADHEEELRRRVDEANAVLERTRAEHEETLAKTVADHQDAVKRTETESAATLLRTEEEYYEALTKLRSDHAQALEKQATEAATALERLKDEHARELRMAESRDEHAAAISTKEQQAAEDMQKLRDEHAQALAAKTEQHRESLQRLKADHATALNIKEVAHAEELERLEAEHARALAAKDKEHQSAEENATAEHAATVSQLKRESALEFERLTVALEESRSGRVASDANLRKEMEQALQANKEQQMSVLKELDRAHEEEIMRLKEEYEAILATTYSSTDEQRATLVKSHTEEITKLKADHQTAIAEVEANIVAMQEQHHGDLEKSREEMKRFLAEEMDRLKASLVDMAQTHSEERETLLKDHRLLLDDLQKKHAEELENLSKNHNLLLDELESYKAASDEYAVSCEEMRQTHEGAMQQKTQVINSMQQELTSAHDERDALSAEVAKLRAELQQTREETNVLVKEASKRESLVDELERHRSVLAEMQDSLQRTKDEMDNLQAEKNRQDALLRDLQTQLRDVARKLPPPTPPPTVPIPPAPRSLHEQSSSSSSATMTSSSRGGLDSPVESPSTPATSIAHSTINVSTPTLAAVDPKIAAQLQQQTKQLEEQEAMIKTLNKQLSHCESDLQTHMDLVATLEASLGDSEKNLRKARMQATELARERDNLTTQITSLRAELHETKNEVVNVRRSIVEEKQSLETRLDEERRAKERARAQLDSRMEEVQRRKSKFACL